MRHRGARPAPLAFILGAALLLVSALAQAQPHVEGEMNRAKAALQLKKFDEAARRFSPFAEAGNPVAQFYYTERVTRYMSAIGSCQAQADREGRTVRCLVPDIDWNAKTWESC